MTTPAARPEAASAACTTPLATTAPDRRSGCDRRRAAEPHPSPHRRDDARGASHPPRISVGPCRPGRAEVVTGRSVHRSAVCVRRSPPPTGLLHGPTELFTRRTFGEVGERRTNQTPLLLPIGGSLSHFNASELAKSRSVTVVVEADRRKEVRKVHDDGPYGVCLVEAQPRHPAVPIRQRGVASFHRRPLSGLLPSHT